MLAGAKAHGTWKHETPTGNYYLEPMPRDDVREGIEFWCFSNHIDIHIYFAVRTDNPDWVLPYGFVDMEEGGVVLFARWYKGDQHVYLESGPGQHSLSYHTAVLMRLLNKEWGLV